MHFNGQTFSGVFEHYFYFKVIWVKNAKFDFFYKKNGFVSSFFFIKFTLIWLQSFLLEKHQTSEILLMIVFYAFLKMLHFSKNVEIF